MWHVMSVNSPMCSHGSVHPQHGCQLPEHTAAPLTAAGPLPEQWALMFPRLQHLALQFNDLAQVSTTGPARPLHQRCSVAGLGAVVFYIPSSQDALHPTC